MASMRPRTRKDGSTFWEVLFRHDGRQRSLSFETPDHEGKFKELVGLVGPGKALEVYGLTTHPRSVNGNSMTVEEWINRHIDHLTGCEHKTLDEYRRFLGRDISPVLGPIPLASLTAEDVERWVQNLKANGNSGKTIQNKHGFLSAALNAAVPRSSPPLTGWVPRLTGEGLFTDEEIGTTCCFATQDKVWVTRPAGEKWEVYTVLADSETFGNSPQHLDPDTDDAVCCGGESIREEQEVTAQSSCC